jgi:CBS domain-containing membrane protein
MIAVLSNTQSHALNWQFCYEVVLVNAVLIAAFGILINRYLLRKRYPMMHTHHQHHQETIKAPAPTFPALNEDNFKWAISQMDGIIDVTEEDLVDLYEFAVEHANAVKEEL